jgi:AraC family transcriptional activator of mtrCDE
VQAIDEELQAARPGAATIATELATALFVMMLRLISNSPRHRAA